MHAEVSDEIIVRGRHVGDDDRKGVITEVHGEGGAPPSAERWAGTRRRVRAPATSAATAAPGTTAMAAAQTTTGAGSTATGAPAAAVAPAGTRTRARAHTAA